jgi:UPF0716 protein FxsA
VAWLILLFVVAPVVELYVIVAVAGAIGWLPTLAFLVLSSIAGAWLTKVEGLGVLRRMGATVDQGQLPADEAIDGLLISVGGLLMFVPGFISTFVGLALMVPPVRRVVRPIVAARIRRRAERAQARMVAYSVGFGPDSFGPDGFGSSGYGAPIDVDSRPWTEPGSPRPPGAAGDRPPELGS